jgi:hypothetical protein
MSVDPAAPPEPATIEPELQRLPADELKLLTDYRRVSPLRKQMLRETAQGYVMLEKHSESACCEG